MDADIRNFVRVGNRSAGMPYLFFKNSLAYRVPVVITMVVAYIVIYWNRLEWLDIEIQLEDRVTSGLRGLMYEIDTGTIDNLAAPFDSVACATLVGFYEVIGWMYNHAVGNQGVASLCRLQ